MNRSSSFQQPKKDPPIQRDLPVTLQDVLHGTVKQRRITRSRVNPDRVTTRLEDKILKINVQKGWKAGTKITFAREGNEDLNGNEPADVVFIVQDSPHPHLKREGCDVRYVAEITLKQALCGGVNVRIPTIEETNTVGLRLEGITKPGSIRRISQMGLPDSKKTTQRGDIIVEFKVIFPTSLTSTQTDALKRLLPD